MPLHIFEERYREMIADCEASPGSGVYGPFGVSLAKSDGTTESIGCTVVTQKIGQRCPDGSFDIVGRGGRRYLTRETFDDRSYVTAQVEYVGDVEEEADAALASAVGERLSQLAKLVSGTADQSESEEGQPAQPDANGFGSVQGSFAIAARSVPEAEKRQQLLEMTSENNRLQFLIDHLDGLLPVLRDRIEEQKRAKSNGQPRDR
jgi:ATP-dependent Lon protease